MSKRDVRLFLEDIMKAIVKVERYTAGLSFEEFENNEIVIDAVTRNLEVIGEAAKHIPLETRAGYDAIDWRKVAGFRDIAIHAYFDVDVEIVWTIVSQQLADLRLVVIQMLHDLKN
jgi:uncharacterized protein with HEPN domain